MCFRVCASIAKAEILLGAHHGWAKYFADKRGFETLSAPASLAATLRGFTSVSLPPAAPLADDTDKPKKSATEQNKAQVMLLTIRAISAIHVIRVIRGSASALLVING